MIVYDTSNRTSFNSLKKWVRELKSKIDGTGSALASPNLRPIDPDEPEIPKSAVKPAPTIMIVGNKIDGERQISQEEAQGKTQKKGS